MKYHWKTERCLTKHELYFLPHIAQKNQNFICWLFSARKTQLTRSAHYNDLTKSSCQLCQFHSPYIAKARKPHHCRHLGIASYNNPVKIFKKILKFAFPKLRNTSWNKNSPLNSCFCVIFQFLKQYYQHLDHKRWQAQPRAIFHKVNATSQWWYAIHL